MKILPLFLCSLILAGCSVELNPLDKPALQEASRSSLVSIYGEAPVKEYKLTAQDVTQRVMINNLDTRLSRLQRALSDRQLQVSRLDLLPSIVANAGYNQNNGQGMATDPDPINTADLTFTWSVLDFAIGYFNAKQSADRALMAREQERRASFDLIRQSQEAFWQAYAAQQLQTRVQQNIKRADQLLDKIQKGEQEGLTPRLESITKRKTVLGSIRQLEGLNHELARAKITLAQLVNVPQNSQITLVAPSMKTPKLAYSLSELETRAMTDSPDIREQLYNKRVSAAEVRKAAIGFLPSPTMNLSRQLSDDALLDNSAWSQYGMNVGFDLMRLATSPQRMKASKKAQDIETLREMTLRVAVLAQTHLAYRDWINARTNFNRASQMYDIELAYAEEMAARREAAAGTEVDEIVSETSEIMAAIERFKSYGAMASADVRLHAVIGDDSVLTDVIAKMDATLKKASQTQETAKDKLSSIEADFKKLKSQEKSLDKQRANLDRKIAKLTSETEAARQNLKKAQKAQKDLKRVLTKAGVDVTVSLNTQLKTARLQLSEQNKDLRAHMRLLRKTEKRIAGLGKSKSPDKALASQLDKDHKAQLKNLSSLQAQKDEAQSNLERLLEHRAQMKAFEKMKTEFEKEQTSLNTLSEALQQTKDQMQVLQKEISSLVREIQALETQQAKVVDELRQASLVLSSAEM